MVKPKDPLRITHQDLVTRYANCTCTAFCARLIHSTCVAHMSHCWFTDMQAKGFTVHVFVCSGQGETVINILTDLNGFWTYENRELMLAENQNTSENV